MHTNTTIVLSVPGISCGHCVAAITGEVQAVAGVERVEVSIDAKTVTVTVTVTGAVDVAAIEAAIIEAGYEVDR